MTGGQVLAALQSRGVVLEPQGDKLHYQAPKGVLTTELLQAMAEHKAEILVHLRQAIHPLGDGQPPPLDRPPQTEQELRRLIDHLADPAAFTRWMEWAMQNTDQAESPGRCL